MIRMYDLIAKKRDGGVLTEKEIRMMIDGYVSGEIPDYQMSAMLMAIYLRGMTNEETSQLTMAMMDSGDVVDLSAVKGVKIDKHSTGGVGDKTTLILAPIMAACGMKVAKMSGRGLGHTGGTIDKLESIPGFRVELGEKEFIDCVNRHGIAVIGQSKNLVPADKMLYALRDVTATVESIPLIASSIMSKKLAAGSDVILLDVKVGSGAFMKSKEDAKKLACQMVDIGKRAGKKIGALITDMNQPLGRAVGNQLEVEEALNTLQMKGPEDLTAVCLELSAYILYLANVGKLEFCKEQARHALESGAALEKFWEMVQAQGGDKCWKVQTAPVVWEVFALRTGYVMELNAQMVGEAAAILGAGRTRKEESIDYQAGVYLKAKCGDYVEKGDVLAFLYTSEEERIETARERLLKAYQIGGEKPDVPPHIYEVIL